MECQVEEKMVDNSMVSIPGILSLFLRCGLLFKVQEPNVILNVTSPIFDSKCHLTNICNE